MELFLVICVGICANQNTAIRRMITEVNAANGKNFHVDGRVCECLISTILETLEGKIVRRDGREEGIARVDTTWAIIAGKNIENI